MTDLRELLGEAFCLTVIEPDGPMDLADVVTRLGGTPSDADDASEHPGAWHEEEYGPCRYLISQQGTRWLVAEYNNFQGSRNEVAEALSASARTWCLYEGMSSQRFLHARDGVVLVGFDPLNPDGRYGTEPDVLGADLEPFHAVLDAFDEGRSADPWGPLAELFLRRSGAVPDQAWWEGPHWFLATGALPDHPAAPATTLEAALAAAPLQRTAAVLRAAVTEAARVTGILDSQPVRRALADAAEVLARTVADGPVLKARSDEEMLAAQRRRDAGALERFRRFEGELSEAYEAPRRGVARRRLAPMESDPVWHRFQAGLALTSLLIWCSDPGRTWEDPGQVCLHVRLALQDAWPQAEAGIITALAAG